MANFFQSTYPYVSVVVPARNARETLGLCLDGIRNIDYPRDRLELIVVDDGSTDDSREIARRYGAKLLINDIPGLTHARNLGAEAALGDFIAFINGDCVCSRGWLKNSLWYFQDKKIAAVGGSDMIPKEAYGFARASGYAFYLVDLWRGHNISHNYVLPRRVKRGNEVKYLTLTNLILRTDILKRIMPYGSGLTSCDDVEMGHTINRLGYKVIVASDVFVRHYRTNNAKIFWRKMLWYGKGRGQLLRKANIFPDIYLVIFGWGSLLFTMFFITSLLLDSKFTHIFTGGYILALSLIFLIGYILTKSIYIAANFILVVIIMIFGWNLGFLKGLFSYKGEKLSWGRALGV